MSGRSWVPGPQAREVAPPARFDPARLADPVRSLRAHRRAADAASSPGAGAAPGGVALATDVREAVAVP